MSMEISEMGHAVNLHQNAPVNTAGNVEKTTETKEVDARHSKATEETTAKHPRYDTVEISDTGKKASDLMQKRSYSSNAAYQYGAKENVSGTARKADVKQQEAAENKAQNVAEKKNNVVRNADTEKEENKASTVQNAGAEKEGNKTGAVQNTGVEKKEETKATPHPDKIEKPSSKKEEEDPTDDLSSLTEAELKQIYLKGDITKTEYEDELEDRGIVEEE